MKPLSELAATTPDSPAAGQPSGDQTPTLTAVPARAQADAAEAPSAPPAGPPALAVVPPAPEAPAPHPPDPAPLAAVPSPAAPATHLGSLAQWYFQRVGSTIDCVLRDREQIYEDIAAERNLDSLVVATASMVVAFGGFYGLSMGWHAGGAQAVASALKVPLLLVLPMAIAIPALHPFNVMLGSRMRIGQAAALGAACAGTTALLLLALSPLSIFALLSGASYALLKVFHAGTFLVAGYFGAFVLYEGLQAVGARVGRGQHVALLQIWLCLYAYVGMQTAWLLRPFIGDPARAFALFRPVEGSFFKGLLDSLTTLVR